MSVRKTGSFPGPIDTQINEIIRSIRELEERVMDIKKSLEPQTEETTYDLERHVFNRDNPHLVTAAQLKALPLEFVLDASSVYIPFHNTLKSTKGLKPSGLYGATRTDYGLIYNDDGSLCATLLPEGGVAVEEGITNIAINSLFEDPTKEWSCGTGVTLSSRITETPFGKRPVLVVEGASNQYTVLTPEYRWSSLPGEDKPVTVSLWMRNLGTDEGIPKFYLGTGYRTTNKTLKVGGEWTQVSRTFSSGDYTATAPFHFYKGVEGRVEVCALLVEYDKSYPGSLCEGTRPKGILGYAETLNPRKGTIHIRHYLYENIGDQYLLCNNISNTLANTFFLHVGNNTEIVVRLPDGTAIRKAYDGNKIKTFEDQDWDIIYDADEGIFDLFIDGELVTNGQKVDISALNLETTLWLSGHLGNMNVGASGIRKNLLIKPYAVSPETVKAWHSLDAPFIDPYVALSQDIPYSNTVDEFKNSTANFAMVNVEGIVKLYARTPEGIIIIETLGNTEVI